MPASRRPTESSSAGPIQEWRAVAAALVASATAGIGPALAADAASSSSSGDWFDPFVSLNAKLIEGIDSVVGSAGLAIILYTLVIKVVTFPLSQPALRTTAILQLVSPQVKKIELENKDDEDTKVVLLKRLYQEVGVNPLTGCLPVLVQLPIFVALFRAIGRLASQDDHFKEPFLWIPSLAGPVLSGQPSLDWLLKTRASDHFEPLVGWHDATMYLVLPFLVVASQFISQKLNNPQQGDNGIQTAFLGFVGVSTLVSPSGLGVYWFTNTILTTLQAQLVQRQVSEELPQYKQILDAAEAEAPQDIRYTRQSPFMKESKAVADSVASLEAGEVAASTRKARRNKAKPR